MSNKQVSADAYCNELFGNKDVVRSLLLDFVPENIIEGFDLSSLQHCSTSFVTPYLEERGDFLVWKARMRNNWCYIFVLLAYHKPDKWIALHISSYTGLLWDSLIRAGKLGQGDKLPPVFPIVVYSGETPWDSATDTRDLFSPLAAQLGGILSQEYYLLDVQRLPKDKLDNAKGLCALIFGIERARNEAELSPWLEKIKDFISSTDFAPIKKEFGLWLEQLLKEREIAIKPGTEIESLDICYRKE